MSALLLAAALALPARAAGPNDPKPYGILLLAYDVDVAWRKELGSLQAALKDRPVETVASAGDQVSLQRAVDKLASQRVAKIVAVPIETMSDAPWLEQARYLFGVREQPAVDAPDSPTGDLADKPLKSLRPAVASTLRTDSGAKRLQSAAGLVLAPALDKSPLLVDILADRAKALGREPAREAVVLIGIAPRSDAHLKDWLTSGQDLAAKVAAKAGFREGLALGVREGVRSDQQDRDRAGVRAAMRGLARKGRIVVVPLAPQADRVKGMFDKTLGGFVAYRWDGRGVQGDSRMVEWIKKTAERSAGLPDQRLFKDPSAGALGGRR